MAKIMLGTMAGAISGALGNDVFSHGRAGYYVRKRVIPTKTVNIYTLKARNILTVCSRSWGALSAAQQQAWSTWAQSHPVTDRLGQKQVLFGAQAYTELNARLLSTGDTAILVPPATASPAPLTTLSFVATASTHTVALTTAPTPLGANYRLWILAATTLSPGHQYLENAFKLISFSAKNVATGFAAGADMELRFGTLIVTEPIQLRVMVFDSTTGLLSGPKNAYGNVV